MTDKPKTSILRTSWAMKSYWDRLQLIEFYGHLYVANPHIKEGDSMDGHPRVLRSLHQTL